MSKLLDSIPTPVLSFALLLAMLGLWQLAVLKPAFDPTGKTENELLTMQFNGDIVENEDGGYDWNPEKQRGFPGPLDVLDTAVEEFSKPFHVAGPNDHGIGWLILYTLARFVGGFLAASVVAVLAGVAIGLSPKLFDVVNPFLQVLKPISPLAWMPVLFYSVGNPRATAFLVVFMASLWPTIANTAFGVGSIGQDFLRVSGMLEFSWWERLRKVVLPAAGPAIVAGLRISFGSALVAVVPAEMLLGELGVGYLSWTLWNNLDVAGVLFAIVVMGVVGYALDTLFSLLAKRVTYAN